MTRAHLFISGRVQMVLFRASTQQKAKKFKVKGFVKNLPDKRVEAIIEGEQENVDKLIEWCRRGPILAKVKGVEVIQEEYTGEFNKFDILY
ncbi:acylphosphatase [Patescibacteria group bacterium]|nr:acylphosphatase [Patescibacteria group bacterium]